jgi:hypothetical protein
MEESMKVNGKKTTWKVWVCTHGEMEGSLKVSTKTIRNMGMEFTLGLMAAVTKDIGQMGNNMV